MIVRLITTEDINEMTRLRLNSLKEYGNNLDDEDIALLSPRIEGFFQKHLSDGTCIGALAEKDGLSVAAAILILHEKPASPEFITGLTGTLMNVITLPGHRRQGIAAKVVTAVMQEAKRRGVSVIDLFATESGKPLYDQLGFRTLKYTAMRKSLL